MNEAAALEAEFRTRVAESPETLWFFDENLLDGVWYFNPESKAFWASEKYWTNLGFDPEDEPWNDPHAWMHIVFQEDQDEANEIMLAHFADPTTPFRTLTRYRHLDGSTRWARIQGMAVRNEDGVPYRLLGANIDVTDLILANQELQSTNDALVESNAALLEAQQANDLLAAYTNVAAHDLRSPARKVLQFASRLRRAEGELSERGEQTSSASRPLRTNCLRWSTACGCWDVSPTTPGHPRRPTSP